jgi:8-oxo-dGTP pyrophosphatase MutT (NUDIX family)
MQVEELFMTRHAQELGTDHYREMQLPISVKAVAGRDGRVALLKNERDEWELPGGKLSDGETPEECVVREVEEELGWQIELKGLLNAWVYTIRPDRVVFVITYASHVLSEEDPILSHEHKELALVPIDDVPTLNMPREYKIAIQSWADQGLSV